MSKLNNVDEYNEIISGIEHMNIPLPENLEGYVEGVLEGLPKKRSHYVRRFVNVAAGFVVMVILLSGLIYSNESFAAVVKNIPGLSYLVDLITTDLGSESAMIHDYPVKDPMTFEGGDYGLTLENMMIDEERITFSARLEGPYFDRGDEVDSDNKDELVEEGIIEASGKPIYNYHIYLIDSDGVITSSSYQGLRHQSISIAFGEERKTYISDLIISGQDLVFGCDVMKEVNGEEEIIYRFSEFSVPVGESDVLRTVHVEVDKTIELEEGNIHFNELTISPSKMQLIGMETPGSDYEYIGFDRLNVSVGKRDGSSEVGSDVVEFLSPSMSRYGGGDGYVAYQLIPSVYFDDVEELVFSYESYYYGLAHEGYTLSLDDEFPKAYDYYGYEFVIEEVSLVDGVLEVVHTITDGDKFSASLFDFEGYDFIRSVQTTFEEDGIVKMEFLNYLEGVGDVREFSFTLEHPVVMVEEKGEFSVEVGN